MILMLQRQSKLYLLILWIAPLILFSPVIFTGKALYWGTSFTQFVPWWTLAWSQLKGGELPLWNPLVGMGAPLVANYQSGLFYPLNWSYFLLAFLGGVPAIAWWQAVLVVIHLGLAGMGTALLVRKLGLPPLAQLIAGLSYSLSGYLVSRVSFLSINAATVWLPWILFITTNLFITEGSMDEGKIPVTDDGEETPPYIDYRRKRLLNLILLTIQVALLLLSGHAQTAFYTLLFTVAWALFLTGWKLHHSAKTETPGISSLSSAWISFLSASILGTALAAIQLLPTLEYLQQSQRASQVAFNFAMTYSFWPWHLLTIFVPGLFGSPVSGDYWGYANYWEDAVYIGLISILLAILAVVFWRRAGKKVTIGGTALIWFLVGMIAVVFLFALGKNLPIFPWLYQHLPGLDMFQAPTRWSLLAVFSLSLLAAIGSAIWQRPTGRKLYWTRLGTMATVAILVAAGLASLVSQSLIPGIKPSFIRALAWLGFWGVGIGILTLIAPREGEPRKTYAGINAWGWAVIAWLMIDLLVAGWGLNPAAPLSLYVQPAPNASQVDQLLYGGRLFLSKTTEENLKFKRFWRFDSFNIPQDVSGWENLRAALLPNTGILDGLPSANNFDPLWPARYATWMETLEKIDGQTRDGMLNLMGVRVVENIDVSQPGGVSFSSRMAPPIVSWVSCRELVINDTTALEKVVAAGQNLDRPLVLEQSEVQESPICQEAGSATIQVSQQHATKLVMEVVADSPGYVVIRDTWYPGWQAKIDGNPIPILHADYLFRAMPVPAGDHTLEVVYRPASFIMGAAISLAGLLCLLMLFIFKSRIKS